MAAAVARIKIGRYLWSKSLKPLRLNTYWPVLRQSMNELLCKVSVYRRVENDASQNLKTDGESVSCASTAPSRFIVQRLYLQVSCARSEERRVGKECKCVCCESQIQRDNAG